MNPRPMLTSREADILNIIVTEYVTTRQPVGSKQIASHLLKEVSSATIRNDMAELQEGGYITRPHISAGGVPSNAGYRRYVASLAQNAGELSTTEIDAVMKRLKPGMNDISELLKTAAQCLAELTQNAVMITHPIAEKQRLVHFDLVKVNSTDALLVLVLPERRIKSVTVKFHETISQNQMTFIANRLNGIFSGMNPFQIRFQNASLSHTETAILDALLSIMNLEDATQPEMQIAGVKYLLAYPEFADGGGSGIVGALEDSTAVVSLLARALKSDAQVLIGDEMRNEPLKECSIVAARYGVADESSGMIGVIGPTRLRYDRVMALTRKMSSSLNSLLADQYGRVERT